jgi:hypothetical protein
VWKSIEQKKRGVVVFENLGKRSLRFRLYDPSTAPLSNGAHLDSVPLFGTGTHTRRSHGNSESLYAEYGNLLSAIYSS